MKFFYGCLVKCIEIIKCKKLLITHSFSTVILHKVTAITSVFLSLHLKAGFQ